MTADLGLTGSLAVQGPGGTGKTRLLKELEAAYRRAGLAVVDAGTAPDSVDGSTDLAVLIDDAHLLTDESARRVLHLVQRPGARTVLAFRPWPRTPALRAVIDALGSDRRSMVLSHVDRSLVQSWAREQLDGAATPALVDFVLRQTGGLPALVHPLLAALARRADDRSARRPGGDPIGCTIPAEVTDLVRGVLTDIDDDVRSVLHATAAGAPVDADVLAELLDVSQVRATTLVAHARATGLLLDRGDVVPLVQSVLLDTTPRDVTRSTRRRLLSLLLDHGDEPVDLARTLATEHIRDPRAARLLERHGSAALTTNPRLAGELLGAAAAAGASETGLAARRAQAAALAGNFDTALLLADTVLSDQDAPDRGRAAAVTAAVLARRGLPARSAALYRLAGPERSGSAALSLVAIGSAEEALAVLDAAESAAALGCPSTLSGSEALMARGILQSLRCSPDAGGDISASLSLLSRAATLLEPIGRTALLPDTPAALAALVAVHCGELHVAESVLERTLAADVGGPPSRPRHHLLLGWVAMLRGRMAAARECIDRALAAAGPGLEPRDEVFHQALEVGLARRRGDSAALVGAWGRAREALLRYPIDLFTLLPLGELIVAGARVQDGARLAPHMAEAQALLARLGNPRLWATPLHWSGAQAAILNDDPDELRPHAAALVAAALTSPYAATLARAGRAWMRVLGGDIDAGVVERAARDLAAVGLAWDGSRLAGQAAARTADPRARTSLLSCARVLTEGSGAGDPTPVPAPTGAAGAPAPLGGALSEREREVARLVVSGQTYREIGGRLFISAKTVEHHVSRMRQRLGASNRSDLLARLRLEVAEGA